MKNVVNYILSAQKKIFVVAFLAVFSSFYTNVWGDRYVRMIPGSESLTSGSTYLIGIEDRKTGKYYFLQSDGVSKYQVQTVISDTVTDPNSRIIWEASKSGDLWRFYCAKTEKYLYWNGSSVLSTTYENSSYQWYISSGSVNNPVYKYFKIQYNSNTGRYLSYAGSSGFSTTPNSSWASGGVQLSGADLASGNGDLQIFKKVVPVSAYTVTYNAGTGTCATPSEAEGSAGAGVTLPVASTTADGYAFAGWATASTNETKNSPTLFKAGTKFYPSGNCTLYAVYVLASNDYKKVTASANISPGKYLVVNTDNSVAMKAAITSDYYLDKVSVTISDNTITSPGNTIVWEVTKESNIFHFYNANSNKWLESYPSGSNHYLRLHDGKGGGYTTYIAASGNVVFPSVNEAGRYITYSTTNNRFFNSTNSSNIQLYKQDNTYNSNPIVCGELDDINGEVSWSSPANAEVSWNNIANVDSWNVNYKIHGAGEWTAWDGAQTVYTESETDDKRKVIITDLSCGRYYDFQIVASPAEDYCDKDETLDNSGSGYNSGGFTFWYGTTQGSEDHTECFSQVGETTTWLTDLWTIPSANQYTYVGNPAWIADVSANLQLINMKYALNRACALGSIGKNVMEGAQGYIRIYSDNTVNGENKWVGFIPAGYVLRWGTDENGWSSIPFVAASENIEEENWNTPLHTWTSDNAAKYTYVGLKTESDYVWSNRSETRRPIFLKPNANWMEDDAKFVMYFWDGSSHTGYSAIMTDPDGDGIYEAWIPNTHAYTNVIFGRLKPVQVDPVVNWDNKWNKTVDLTLPSDKNVFTIESGSGDAYTGSWSVYDKKGTFHISANSNTYNWYCHFLPHHVLTFDANGGEDAPEPQSVAINASPCQITVTSDIPTRDGYYFLGWSTNSEASSPDGAWDPEDTHTMTEDVTLYAVWEPAVVTFEATTNANWNTAGNWDPNFVPNINTDVILNKPVTVNTTAARAKSVVINQEGDNTGQLVVDAGQKLIVAGTIQKTTDGETYSATEANDIIIHSDATHGLGLGALVMGTHDGTNQATVNFTTLSRGTSEDNTSIAQYVGTPFNDETNILHNWYNSWVYGITYDGSKNIGWERVNEGQGMAPFKGYCVFSADGTYHNYWQQGTLVASKNQTISGLNCQSDEGTANPNNENLLANSWVAPIKINAMESSDFTNADATVYIFNSTSNSAYVDLGNYATYPVNSVADAAIIPSMQSFSVFTTGSGASVSLDYSKIVYDPAVGGTVPGPNKAPRLTKAETAHRMKLYVSAENGYSDMLYLLEHLDFEEGFENGWDGHKLFGESVAPQLYAVTPDGNMAVNCVPTYEGVVMGFKAGEQDNSYTFTFEYSDEAQPLYLLDIQTNIYTQITSATSYSFTTTDTEVHNRFVLTYNAPSTPTALETTPAVTTGKKVMYDNHLFILHNGRIFSAQGAMIQ